MRSSTVTLHLQSTQEGDMISRKRDLWAAAVFSSKGPVLGEEEELDHDEER